MIDTFFSILFGIPYLIAFWCIMWWVLVSNFWYAVLVPFYIGCVYGIVRKDARWPLIGFGICWVASWIVAFIILCNVKIN